MIHVELHHRDDAPDSGMSAERAGLVMRRSTIS